MATLKDIAQATGVSCTTVSNVIHGRSNRVSAETIQAINDAIKELGYVPNMSARSLVSRSSRVIGFINHVVTDKEANFMEDPFHSIFIGILERILRENGYYLMLRTVESAEDLVAFLQNWNVDGLFFTGVFKDHFFDVLSSLSIPVVLIDSYVHQSNIGNVGLEDCKGSRTATQYLISRGHRRIAFASPSFNASGVLQERFFGYCEALQEAGIPYDPQLIFKSEMDMVSCQAVSQRLAALLPDVTALVTTADFMAANIMSCLQRIHVRIPEDISIIGFDDINLCQILNPQLTTIHQDMKKKGILAVNMMLQKLEGATFQQSEIILPTRLVERESVRSV